MDIISYAIDKQTGIYTSDGRHITEAPFLDVIANDGTKDTIKVFTHLDADVAGLIALCKLTHKELETLSRDEHLTPTGSPCSLTYYPGKFFGIGKRVNGDWKFSGIADMSHYDVELERIEDNHTSEYWFAKVKKSYDLAVEVYKEMMQIARDYGRELHIKSMISAKNMWEPIFDEIDMPTYDEVPEEAAITAYEACMGNWVEVYQRGRFEHATDFDISSAYPHWASHLLNLRDGFWVESSDYQPKAYYGYLDVEVNIDSKFSPVLWKNKEQENYSFTGVTRVKMTKNLFDYINKREKGFGTIVKGWWWAPTKVCKPFEKPIEKLYDLKKRSSGLRKELIKGIMNGCFYGNLLQDAGGKKGKHFMPPYAAEIEANTRIQVAEFIESNNLVDRLLAIAVDGAMINGEVDNFVDSRNGMGSWRKSYEGEAVVINNGLTCIDGKFGQGDFSISLETLKELFNPNIKADSWSIDKLAVKTLGQAINEHKPDSVGDLYTMAKTFYLDDFKREWVRNPKNAQDILSKVYNSKPYDIDRIKIMTESTDEELEEEYNATE